MSIKLIIDLVSLLILIVSIVIGAKHGFSKTFVKTFGTILSLILAIALCSTCANFLQDRFGWVEKIAGWLSGKTKNIFGEVVDIPIKSATQQNLSEGGLALWLINIVLSVKGDINLDDSTTINTIISPVFAYYIVLLIALIILFVLFSILLFLFSKVIKSLYFFKPVKHIDISLGLALGLIRGIIIVQLAIIVVGFIPISFCQDISSAIPETFLTNLIYGTNLFSLLINNLSTGNVSNFVLNLFK